MVTKWTIKRQSITNFATHITRNHTTITNTTPQRAIVLRQLSQRGEKTNTINTLSNPSKQITNFESTIIPNPHNTAKHTTRHVYIETRRMAASSAKQSNEDEEISEFSQLLQRNLEEEEEYEKEEETENEIERLLMELEYQKSNAPTPIFLFSVDFVNNNIYVVRKFIINKRFEELKKFLQTAYDHPDNVYNFIVVKLCKIERAYEAYILTLHLIERGDIEFTAAEIITLVNSLIRIRKFDYAKEMFNHFKNLIHPTVYSYALLVKLHSYSYEFEKAERYLEEMKNSTDESLRPNAYIYLHLIEGYSRQQHVHRILELIEEMERNNVERSTPVYNGVLKTFLNIEYPTEVLRIFKQMNEGEIDIAPDVATLSIVISAYFQLGDVETAMMFFETSLSLYAEAINTPFYNTMLEELIKVGDNERFYYVLQSLRASHLSLDTGTFSTLVKRATIGENIKELENLWFSIRTSNVKPNISMLNRTITLYMKFKCVDEAIDYHCEFYNQGFKSNSSIFPRHLNDLIFFDKFHIYSEYFFSLAMSDRGPKLGYSVFNLLIVGFHQKMGNCNRAMAIYRKMSEYDIRKSEMTYKVIIPVLIDLKRYQEAVQCFDELLSIIPTIYILPPDTVHACLYGLASVGRYSEFIEIAEKIDYTPMRWNQVMELLRLVKDINNDEMIAVIERGITAKRKRNIFKNAGDDIWQKMIDIFNAK